MRRQLEERVPETGVAGKGSGSRGPHGRWPARRSVAPSTRSELSCSSLDRARHLKRPIVWSMLLGGAITRRNCLSMPGAPPSGGQCVGNSRHSDEL